MSGFTEGPWEFVFESGENHIRAGNESLMCNMTYYPWVPEKDEDWHLISAAPDMYAILAAIMDSGDADLFEALGEAGRQEIMAALAKAEGKV
jgi:hypothetical protein